MKTGRYGSKGAKMLSPPTLTPKRTYKVGPRQQVLTKNDGTSDPTLLMTSLRIRMLPRSLAPSWAEGTLSVTCCGPCRTSDAVSQFVSEHAETPGLLRARSESTNLRKEWSWCRTPVNAFAVVLEVVNA